MNIFVSSRIKPSNVKFPKGYDKLEWNHISTYKEFVNAFIAKKAGTIVIDSAGLEDGSAFKVACAVTEITIEKHIVLPTILVIGPNAEAKTAIEEHLTKNKKWVDISRGK